MEKPLNLKKFKILIDTIIALGLYLDEETGKRMSATFKNDKLVGIAKDE